VLALALGCSSEEPEKTAPQEIAVRLRPQGGPIHTKGIVRFEVEVDGTPDAVTLVRDGGRWVELDDTLAFEWDTTVESERTFVVSAVATAGEKEVTSESVTVEVDRTPPTIQSRTPTPMEVLLVGTYGITVNFSEPILLGSLTESSVRLTSGVAEIPARLMLAADQRLLSVVPQANLGEGTYKVELTDRVTDLAGNGLLPTSWSWNARMAMEKVELSVDGVAGHVVVTNKPIVFRVAAEGAPQRIDLLRNGTPWMTLSGESFAWDLSGFLQGALVVQAQADYGFHQVLSNVVNVNVDRTRPVATPSFTSFVSTKDLPNLQFNLSEPLAPASLTDDSVVVSSPRGTPARRTLTYVEGGWNLGLRVQGTQAPDRLLVSFTEGVTDIAGNGMLTLQVPVTVSDWKGLGGALNENEPRGLEPAAASLPDGHPVVVWTDQTASLEGRVRVRRWSGTAWSALPDPSGGGGFAASMPAVALTPSDRPVVTWTEATSIENPSRLVVSRWNGTTWQRLGDSSLNVSAGCDAWEPTIAVDGSGNPVVAWSEQVTCMPGSPLPERQIFVKRWNGADWDLLGAEGLRGTTSATSPSVAIDRQGVVVVAWVRDQTVRIHRWDGSAWSPFAADDPLPDPAAGTAFSRPRLAIDPTGRAVVAIAEEKSGGSALYALHVKRFDGEAWEALGGGPVASKRPIWIDAVSLVLDRNGEPIVAWGEIDPTGDGTAYVSKWSGSAWTQAGPGECFTRRANGGGMALAIDLRRPVVALSQTVPVDGSILVRSPE